MSEDKKADKDLIIKKEIEELRATT